MDYVRARTNATVDGNDLGRTRRQRDMMTAVFNRLITNTQSAFNLLDVLADPNAGFFTNMTNAQALGFLALAPRLLSMSMDNFSSYSLDGKYRTAMQYNFTFTDQELRAEVIKTVYGIDVEPLPYVSYEHTKWLTNTGIASIHAITVAGEFMDTVKAMRLRFTKSSRRAWDTLDAEYWTAVDLFQQAADTLDYRIIGRMKNSRDALRNAAKKMAELIEYEEDLPWNQSIKYWYDDPYVNEYQLDWR